MSKKVLLIEDSKTDAEVVRSLLLDENLDVEVAYSGNEGFKKAIEIRPDLIFLDLNLPDINGIEVCAKIKREKSLEHSIVVILSISDDMHSIRKAFAVNADDYIIKPPEAQFLVKKVKLYLGMR